MRILVGVASIGFLGIGAAATASEAHVERVLISPSGDGYYLSVTVRHADTGWDHYADAWEVVGPDGTVLGKRVLHHPHVNEQPFTRSQDGVKIPENVSSVTVRAHDSVHGHGGTEKTVKVPR